MIDIIFGIFTLSVIIFYIIMILIAILLWIKTFFEILRLNKIRLIKLILLLLIIFIPILAIVFQIANIWTKGINRYFEDILTEGIDVSKKSFNFIKGLLNFK